MNVKHHWRTSLYKQTIEEKIRQRRSQMLIHSHIYYEMDDNIVDDHTWQRWADELAELQDKNPDNKPSQPRVYFQQDEKPKHSKN